MAASSRCALAGEIKTTQADSATVRTKRAADTRRRDDNAHWRRQRRHQTDHKELEIRIRESDMEWQLECIEPCAGVLPVFYRCQRWRRYCSTDVSGCAAAALPVSAVAPLLFHRCQRLRRYCSTGVSGGAAAVPPMSAVAPLLFYRCQRWRRCYATNVSSRAVILIKLFISIILCRRITLIDQPLSCCSFFMLHFSAAANKARRRQGWRDLRGSRSGVYDAARTVIARLRLAAPRFTTTSC